MTESSKSEGQDLLQTTGIAMTILDSLGVAEVAAVNCIADRLEVMGINDVGRAHQVVGIVAVRRPHCVAARVHV